MCINLVLYLLLLSYQKGLGLHEMVDFELQFEKSFIEPLRFITDKVFWRIDDSYGQQGTLEDFFG